MPTEVLQLKTNLSREHKSPSFLQYPLNARAINYVNAHRRELFSNTSFELKQTLRGHDGIIMCMYSHTYGSLTTLYTGSWDKTVISWNASSGEAICRYIGHQGYISSILVDDHNEILYTASSDKTIRAWVVKTGQMLCVFRGHNSHVQSIQLIHRSPHSNLHPPHEDMEVEQDDEKKVTFYKASFFAKEERKKKLFDILVSASADATIRFWNILTGECLQCFHCGDPVRVIEIRESFLFAIASRKISVFSLELDELTDVASLHKQLSAHKDIIWALKIITLNGAFYALTGSFDRTIILWDVDTGKEIMPFLGHTNQVYCLEFDEETKTIYSGSADTTAMSWDITTGKKLMRFAGHLGSVECLQIVNGLLYTASTDTTIRVWKKETGKCLSVYRGHGDCILHMNSFMDYSRRHATIVNSLSSFFPSDAGPPVDGITMIVTAAMEKEILVWKSFKNKLPSKLSSWNIFAKEDKKESPYVDISPTLKESQPASQAKLGRSDSRGHKRSVSEEDTMPLRRLTNSKSSPSVMAAILESETQSKKSQDTEKPNGLSRSPSTGSPSTAPSTSNSSTLRSTAEDPKNSMPEEIQAQHNDKGSRMHKRMTRLIHHQQLQQFRSQVQASQQLFAHSQHQQKQQRTLRSLETKLTGQGSIHTTDLLNILDTLEQSIQQEQERLQKLKQIILESQNEQKKHNIDAKVVPATTSGTTTPTSTKSGPTRLQKVASTDSLQSTSSVTETPAVFIPPAFNKVNSNLTLTPVLSSQTLSDLIPISAITTPATSIAPSLTASTASQPASSKSSRRTSLEKHAEKIAELETLQKELARLSVNSETDPEFDSMRVSSKLNLPGKDRKSMALPKVSFEGVSTTGLDSRPESRKSSHARLGEVPKSQSLPELHNSLPKESDLITAIQDNDIDEVKNLIINHQLDVNTVDDNLMTPLIWAARTNNTSCAKLLLQCPKLEVNKEDILGWTALHYAANCGHTEVLAMLLRHPEINVKLKNLQKQRAIDVTHRKEIINLLHVAQKKSKLKAQPPGSLRVTSNPIFGKPLVATSSILKALKDEHLTFSDLKKQIQQLEAVNDALEREIKLEATFVPEV